MPSKIVFLMRFRIRVAEIHREETSKGGRLSKDSSSTLTSAGFIYF
ncbi:hypothetical protein ACU8KH_04648 [Lachancea thermotolerans]